MSEYSSLEKFFHRIALRYESVRSLSFSMDQLLLGNKEANKSTKPPVYVCGLARAGTSILFRTLYSSGDFASLTYRDMPFVLAPRLWRNISKSYYRSGAAQERAHKDGLLVSFDSPEAFEEVFWLTFCRRSYVQKTALVEHHVDEEILQLYRGYVSSIISASLPSKQRYLCKNNNNILRIESLVRAFPDAQILLPFREPLQHSASLLRQHENFCKQQSRDQFVLDYMRWLGHYEFGLEHRAFDLGHSSQLGNPRSLEYWLRLWINVYSNLSKLEGNNIQFVCFENLCDEPAKTLEQIGEKIACHPERMMSTVSEVKGPAERPINVKVCSQLRDTSSSLYERLVKLAAV